MLVIAFHTPQIDVRGTCVALYDYARYNEEILGNKSIITSKQSNEDTYIHDHIAVIKFTKRFPVYFYTDKQDLHSYLKKSNVNILYAIKYGKKDDIIFPDIKMVVHCVFDLTEPHGNVYAAVSQTLAQKFNYPLYVPHMVSLKPPIYKENMRSELKIPESAIVFGRHGGLDTFDLTFAMKCIHEVVQIRDDIYFIFINTVKFSNHPRVIYLDKIIDDGEKNRFINTCDAMVHAQSLGETFGLAIAEFSINLKPIITYSGNVLNNTYRKILKNNAIYYETYNDLKDILLTFKKGTKGINCYEEYTPKKVMTIFNEVFIQKALQDNPVLA